MNKVVSVALALCVILAAGCSSETDERSVSAGHSDYLQLNMEKTVTRTDLAADGTGSFRKDDHVGLYIDNGSEIVYKELTYDGNEWMPRLRRQEFGDGKLTLSAHYPVVAGVSDAAGERYGFSVAQDQREAGFQASDLLVSQVVLEPEQYQADLYFRHAMHRLRIELSGNTENVELAVRSRLGGVVNLLTGDVLVTDEGFQWIDPAKNEDGSFEAVIYPQSAAPFRDNDGTLLKIIANDKVYDYKAPEKQSDGTALDFFEAGKQFTVKLALKEPVESEWANKKIWVYGVTPAPESAWKQLHTDYTTYYLPWKKEYGWYDCNKSISTGSSGENTDSEMCWAAGDSNLLHWWFAQNKRYIDMYGDRYKGPDPTYP